MRKALGSISGAVQIATQPVLYPPLSGWRRRWARRRRSGRFASRAMAVWRWLVQVGQGRGGFYSYEGLENLAGCRVRNVLEIRPELQQLRVGDRIVLHGRSGFGPEVVRLEPERALVLGGLPTEKGSQAIWGLHLIDGPRGTTRLLERGRGVAGRGLGEQLGFGP